MIVSIGEILFDVFQEYRRLGGAPFNFAAHLKYFGYPVRFISRVGDDSYGKEIIGHLAKEGFNIDLIQRDKSHSTGKVIVSVDNKGIPDFNILPDAAYDFIEYDRNIQSLMNGKIDMIYTGTLVQRTGSGFSTIQRIFSSRDNSTKCFYDMNLRKGCYNDNIIQSTLRIADILKINEDELLYIKNMTDKQVNEKEFIEFISREYSIELIAVTRGENGSSLYAGGNFHSVPGKTGRAVEDTVGAGDAFASIMAIGYLNSWGIDRINNIASEFASVVCGLKGAIPQDKTIYEDFKSGFFKGSV